MFTNFEVTNFDEGEVDSIYKKHGVSSLVAKLLLARNIEDVKSFLNPDIASQWINPNEIKGLSGVVDVIESAIREGKRILIFGDYDLDGISSIVIMMRTIRKIVGDFKTGTIVDYYIPDRFNEGYGITDASILSLRKMEKPDLIITVDCGISCKDEIKSLNKYGVDVVVTDHHESNNNIPEDICWVDPKVSEQPSKVLAGAGVALKVSQALCNRFGLPNFWYELTEFATLGTIADIMPLLYENRCLVSYGIDRIRNNPRPCILSLLQVANKKAADIDSTGLAWGITPRLNSAGRLNNPDYAVNLLMEDDLTKTQHLAHELDKINELRKQETDNLTAIAMAQAQTIVDNNPGLRSLVLAGEGWHEGVRGIVAAKIASKFHVPTIVLTIADNQAQGSARSVGSVDIHKAILQAKDLLIRFGGHKGAAGMSLKVDNLEAFAQVLESYMQSLDPADFNDKAFADCEISLQEITIPNIDSLKILEPFGCNNEEPIFLIRNVFLDQARAVGAKGNHLICSVTDGHNRCAGVMFNVDNIQKYINNKQIAYVFGSLKCDEFRGNITPKIYIKKIIFADELIRDFASEDYSEICQDNVDGTHVENINNSQNDQEVCALRKKWQEIARSNPQKLRQQILHAMIGDGKLHDSQQRTLDILEKGKSALAVLPTGRGKSLIFQVFAATIALRDYKTSLFVYPLRALIADQAYHLENSFGKFGLRSVVLSGQTPMDHRESIIKKISEDYYDIVLTTPEYLDIHCEEFAQNAKIGFVVIDESHHIGEVKIGQRVAYGNMPKIIDSLNNPQVLALSATVSKDVYSDIKKYLPVTELVTDDYERNNLFIDDKRNIDNKDDYLAALVGSGQKTVIYANSRQQTIDIARMLKSRCQHIAMNIGFYNAGMSKSQRKQIEEYFRDNKLCCLVATSAFGEGVNIPDIRHVCLYHLPFSDVEFNQMSGRAGRDGLPSLIHLLYNMDDAQINTNILNLSNANRQSLADTYRWLRLKCQNGIFQFTWNQITDMYENGKVPVPSSLLKVCLVIFEELGLISVSSKYFNDETNYEISMISLEKVELEHSSRFVEGINQISNFENYRDFAISADVKKLQAILRHPITPV